MLSGRARELFLSFIRVVRLTHTYAPARGRPATRSLASAQDGFQALRGIDLEIEAGQYVAIVGANGSGKTTLARHLNALLLPTTGQVWVHGRDTVDSAAVRAIRAEVGMVFQSPADQIVATVVEEDVAFGPENLGVPEHELPMRVRAALEQVGMWAERQRPPHLLSAGQQQRVAIAGVLAMRPRCLVLDEATAMLDPAGCHDVLDVLHTLHQLGLTVVTITHRMQEAARAQRIIVMHQGQVVLDGPPEQVFSPPEPQGSGGKSSPAELASYGLALPPVVELARRLRQRIPPQMLPPGLSTPGTPLTAEQLADALASVVRPVDKLKEPAFNVQLETREPPLIAVRGLCHTYLAGTPLAQASLHDVDVTIAQGQVVALVGATGSGKSTLLQHLNGLLRPQEGQVWVAGHDLGDPATDLRQVRRAVGLAFQHPEDQLFEQYTGDDVAYGPRLAGLSGPALRERVRWAMEWAGLDFEQDKDRPIWELSGGERRKAGLAGVLAMQPQVLLLDEPTAGLDPVARADLLARLQELRTERVPPQGVTLVMATHNMDDVAAMADWMYVLDRGRVALSGSPRQVFAQADRLRSLGLDVPSAVAVMAALRRRGLAVPLDALTMDEAEAAILGALFSPASMITGDDRGSGDRNAFRPLQAGEGGRAAGDDHGSGDRNAFRPLRAGKGGIAAGEFEFLRNVTIGQYLPTGSAFHRLDPRAKLVMAVLFLIGVLASDSLIGQAAAHAAVVAGLLLARIPLSYAWRGLRAALPFLALLALLQVLTIPRNDVGYVFWRWGWLAITTVDLLAAAVSLARFVALILGLSLFSLATSTTELAHGTEHLLRPLQRLGLPAHEFSLMLVIALRFVPLLALEAERMAKAQASRGADLGRGRGNPFQRARRMLPLLVPLFVAALRRAETLATAMEARCYTGGKGRTHLIQLQARWPDVLAVALVVALVALVLAMAWLRLDVRFWSWAFG